MTKQKEEIKDNKPDLFAQDYEQLMNATEKTVLINVEWPGKGDYFQKLSLYENYTPVKTSGSTTLISEI